jgi:hypothetical protein
VSDPHKNYRSDWQTPPEWVEWVHRTMGGIDLDPCAPVQLEDYDDNPTLAGSLFTPAENGLAQEWSGLVYVNPPGSNSVRSVREWWEHAHRQTAIDALTWCFFNCEAAQTLTPDPFKLPGYMVIPRKRVAFMTDGKLGKSPFNRTWFWTTSHPASTPIDCNIIRTGAAVSGVVL